MNFRKLLWHVYASAARVLRLTKTNKLPLCRGTTLGKLGDSFVRRMLSLAFADGAVLVRGQMMRIGGSHELASEGYERETTRLFETLLQEGMTVVDIGAHVGYYTLLAARRVGSRGRVYAFEPELLNYETLRENVRISGYRNVVTMRKAVSNRSGAAKLYLEDNMSHSLYLPQGTRRSIEVETITLDDFFRNLGWPDVHVIKMDIEGAEGTAIEGSAQLIQKCRDVRLIVEFFPARLGNAGTEPGSFLRRLKALGFELRVIDEEKGLRSFQVGDLLSRLTRGTQYVNILCERKS